MILSRLMYVFIIYLILFVTARTFLGYASHSTWKCHSHLCLYLSSSVVAISKIALWALVTLTSHQGTRHDIFFPPHLKCCKFQLYEKCAQCAVDRDAWLELNKFWWNDFECCLIARIECWVWDRMKKCLVDAFGLHTNHDFTCCAPSLSTDAPLVRKCQTTFHNILWLLRASASVCVWADLMKHLLVKTALPAVDEVRSASVVCCRKRFRNNYRNDIYQMLCII